MSPERTARALLLDLVGAMTSDRQVLAGIAASVPAALPGVPGGEPPDAFRLAFVAVELARYYTAFEHLVEMVEKTLAAGPPRSERWHQDLLAAASRELPGIRPPLVRQETRVLLQDLLGFRHFLRNAYAVDLRWEGHLERHVRTLAAVQPLLDADLAAFAAHLRTAAATLEG